ncbi:ferritin-like domain-containing protein [Methylobacterium sp. Leaf118]|uniref:ferritin-like domain-containing protein n=1 Tax=Methylobacterium sp. Leaf118 TaxID=2876562 RepID=UPI001E46E72D|nr:ferritin-like domain-containing protein [Methylobacterium sp. Leaf118]
MVLKFLRGVGRSTGAAPAPDGVDRAAGRRAFIQSVGLGVAGSAIVGPAAFSPAAAQTVTDTDILNFALNLEYLEAEFYLRAVTGRGLTDGEVTGTGTPGAVTGGRQVNFATAAIRNYATEIASEERIHVQFLRSALGANRVARPAINLTASFTAAAQAAGLITAGQTFDAFADETSFLLAAYIFEDVGVSAYLGAAPLVTSKTILAAAGGILAAEAYHAGTIRTVLYSRGLYTPALKISDARDSLDGASDLDQGIGTATIANLSLTSPANGQAFARTTGQVLNIVYLNPSARPGGFFPAGLNGTIR